MWKVLSVAIVTLLSILFYHEVDNDVTLAEKSVTLSVSRAKVFSFISDLRNFPKWFPGVSKFYAVNDSPLRVGKYYAEVHKWPLYGEVTYKNVVLGYEFPRELSLISNSWLSSRIVMTFTQRDNPRYPSTFSLQIICRRRSYLFRYVIAPVLKLYYSQKTRQALLNVSFRTSDMLNA